MTKWRMRRESGASAVEFALVLPILILFLFGIIQFGLAFARSQGMEAVARESARLASLGGDLEYDDILQAARNTTVPFIDSYHLEVTVDGAQGSGTTWCSDAGDTVEIEASVTASERSRYAISIPLWGSSEPSYASTGVFRCEAPLD